MKKIVSLISTSFLLVSSLAMAEGAVGNGGDSPSLDSGSTWYLGQRGIRYCVDAASNENVVLLRQSLDEAVQKWGNYLAKKGVLTLLKHQDSAPATRLVALPNCDGTEDLTVYFGISTPTTEKYRVAYQNPVSFVQRLSFDSEAGWTKGFLWIAGTGSAGFGNGHPDWSQPDALKAIVLHEWGHIMGFGHANGTIMMADIVRELYKPEDLHHLLGIDDLHRVIPILDSGTTTYSGWIFEPNGSSPVTKPLPEENVAAPKVFSLFVGKEPKGEVHVRLKESRGPDATTYEYILSDDVESHVFPVTFFPRRGVPLDTQLVFKLVRGRPPYMSYDDFTDLIIVGEFSVTKFGTIKTLTGRTVHISFEDNSINCPIEIFALDLDELPNWPIFMATPGQF